MQTGGLLVHGLRPGEPPEGELDGDIGIGWNEAGAQDGIAAGRGNQDRRHNTEHEPLNILVFPWAEGDQRPKKARDPHSALRSTNEITRHAGRGDIDKANKHYGARVVSRSGGPSAGRLGHQACDDPAGITVANRSVAHQSLNRSALSSEYRTVC